MRLPTSRSYHIWTFESEPLMGTYDMVIDYGVTGNSFLSTLLKNSRNIPLNSEK